MRSFRAASPILLSLLIVLHLAGTTPAKDTWTQVKSRNFVLIGNASEKDIRRVGTRLEQFRETFRQIFRQVNLSSPVPTNVVVFKNDRSYDEFRPQLAKGKPDKGVAGYFQPGPDVNYITLSSDGDDRYMYRVIFHEYVHNIIETNFGKSQIPPWFNEGLAEYYKTFEIVDDQVVKLGLPYGNHIIMLQQNALMPFDAFFAIDNYSLHKNGNHSRSIFYAQSWALIHYLTQGGKSDGLNTFMMSVLQGEPAEQALMRAFNLNFDQLERELKKYVGQRKFNYHELTFKQKLTFDSSMAAGTMSEAQTDAYLGDLLYHTHRYDDAEPYLKEALRLDPTSGMANVALGLVKIRQDKFDEAKHYLEAAMAADQRNHIAYYQYAYMLSREDGSAGGKTSSIDKVRAEKMRAALKKAIEISPTFTESYEMLAFVNLVTGERLDESITLLQQALQYQPGNQRYALRMGEVFMRQGKLAEATVIAERIAATADDPETRTRAGNLLDQLGRRREFDQMRAEMEKRNTAALNMANGIAAGDDFDPDDPEINLRSINRALRRPEPGEVRLLGSIQKIDCTKRPLVYTVKTSTETFTLTSMDFQSLALQSFTDEADDVQVGCEANLASLNAVITYMPKTVPKSQARGEIVAIEFVAWDFRFVASAMEQKPVLQKDGPFVPDSATMNKVLNSRLPKLAEGEVMDIGFLDSIECTGEGTIFNLRTPTKIYRLLNSGVRELHVQIYAPEIVSTQFGCGLAPIEYPAVFIYRPTPNGGKRGDGELSSLTFMPKGFELDQKR